MAWKALAVVGLFVALIIAGCAAPTPTPEPTATPSPTPQPTATVTPTPTPQPTATSSATLPAPTPPPPGLATPEGGFEGEDAKTYSSAFADAKALGLGDADARDYANALVYLNALAVAAAWDAFIAENVIGRFIEAFDEAVRTDGAAASDAVSYAYAIAFDGDEARAAAYSKAFAQTEASGVASHLYAVYYVQELGRGVTSPPDEYADFQASLAGANARGYTLSSASSVQERLAYADLYMSGYTDAILMAAHERGYTGESVAANVAANWAEVISGPAERSGRTSTRSPAPTRNSRGARIKTRRLTRRPTRKPTRRRRSKARRTRTRISTPPPSPTRSWGRRHGWRVGRREVALRIRKAAAKIACFRPQCGERWRLGRPPRQ